MNADIKELAKLTALLIEQSIDSKKAITDLSKILLRHSSDLSASERSQLLVWSKVDLVQLEALRKALHLTYRELGLE